MPKMPEFEISARPVTAAENGEVLPDWAEIVLEIGKNGHSHAQPLTRAAGEQVVEQLRMALNPRAGNTITQKIWTELDAAVDELTDVEREDSAEYGQLQGRPQGLALALAILRNPYNPQPEVIKQEARERARKRRSK